MAISLYNIPDNTLRLFSIIPFYYYSVRFAYLIHAFYKLFVNMQLIETNSFQHHTNKDKSIYLCVRCDTTQQIFGGNCPLHFKMSTENEGSTFLQNGCN
jgi:hypothetical protein